MDSVRFQPFQVFSCRMRLLSLDRHGNDAVLSLCFTPSPLMSTQFPTYPISFSPLSLMPVYPALPVALICLAAMPGLANLPYVSSSLPLLWLGLLWRMLALYAL